MHTIELNSHDKTSRYQQLLPQLAALIEDETDLTANLVLDVDADTTAYFDQTDAQYLQQLAALISQHHFNNANTIQGL